MEGLQNLSSASVARRTFRSRAHTSSAALTTAVLTSAGMIALSLCVGTAHAAQPAVPAWYAAQDSAPLDTLYTLSARTGKRAVVTGTITEDGLAEVVLKRGDKETRVESSDVERIAWDASSASMREADVYFERGDFENAASRYKLAKDEEEREVVKAVASRRMGESLLRLGASDPTNFAGAVAEFDSFISTYPKNRALPQVRWMKARAALLAGDAATAAVEYGSLYNEGAGTTPSPGYDPLLCARAGVLGAQALLAKGDTLAARDMFGGVKSRLSAMLSQAEPGNAAAVELEMLAAEADLGEGFALIGSAQGAQAETFFTARLANADASATTRFGATLGLAESHYQQGEFSEARLLFARVAALDFTSRDRVALALLRVAQCRSELKDGEWKPAARAHIEEVLATYGDTPAAFEARQVLQTL